MRQFALLMMRVETREGGHEDTGWLRRHRRKRGEIDRRVSDRPGIYDHDAIMKKMDA